MAPPTWLRPLAGLSSWGALALWGAALIALPATVLVVYGLASFVPQPDPGPVIAALFVALGMGAALIAALVLTLASIGLPLAHATGLLAGVLLLRHPGQRGRAAALLVGHGVGALVVLAAALLLLLAPVLPGAEALPLRTP